MEIGFFKYSILIIDHEQIKSNQIQIQERSAEKICFD